MLPLIENGEFRAELYNRSTSYGSIWQTRDGSTRLIGARSRACEGEPR